jgi:penicillin-binding protein 1A
VRGASTITQQVAKNFLLDGTRKGAKGIERKIKEIILATRLEETMSKDRILELYMNEIDLGYRSFGVAAAAQTYFNKTLDQLTPGEAAYLAALPKSPGKGLRPVQEYDRAVERRNYVLREMWQNGYIDEATYEAEKALPLLTVMAGDYPSYREALPSRSYFTEEIARQLSKNFGEEEFFNGGLTIRATIDPELQRQAEKSLRIALEKYDRGLGRWRGTGKTIDRADWPPNKLARGAGRGRGAARHRGLASGRGAGDRRARDADRHRGRRGHRGRFHPQVVPREATSTGSRAALPTTSSPATWCMCAG